MSTMIAGLVAVSMGGSGNRLRIRAADLPSARLGHARRSGGANCWILSMSPGTDTVAAVQSSSIST